MEGSDTSRIDREIEDLLVYMNLSSGWKPAPGKHNPFPSRPHHYNGAYPFDLNGTYMDSMIGSDVDDPYVFLMEVLPRDIDRSMDTRYIMTNHMSEDEDDPCLYAMYRVTFLTPKEARGKVFTYRPTMAKVQLAEIDAEGRVSTASVGMGWYDTWPVWRAVTHRPFKSRDSILESHQDVFSAERSDKDDYWSSAIQMALAMQFNAQMFWHVYIQYEGCLGVQFPTDTVGAREAFRLRDIPEGRQKRAAIRTWITDHWRKLNREPVEETYVRKHLRGTTDFTWNGMRCVITPSMDDLAKIPELKREREVMRILGTDRRLVRL